MIYGDREVVIQRLRYLQRRNGALYDIHKQTAWPIVARHLYLIAALLITLHSQHHLLSAPFDHGSLFQNRSQSTESTPFDPRLDRSLDTCVDRSPFDRFATAPLDRTRHFITVTQTVRASACV